MCTQQLITDDLQWLSIFSVLLSSHTEILRYGCLARTALKRSARSSSSSSKESSLHRDVLPCNRSSFEGRFPTAVTVAQVLVFPLLKNQAWKNTRETINLPHAVHSLERKRETVTQQTASKFRAVIVFLTAIWLHSVKTALLHVNSGVHKMG